jgi:hypothetical protein
VFAAVEQVIKLSTAGKGDLRGSALMSWAKRFLASSRWRPTAATRIAPLSVSQPI